MTPPKATDRKAADTRRVLEALAFARLPDQVLPETLEAAVSLDDAYASAKAPGVLPASWSLLHERNMAEQADKA